MRPGVAGSLGALATKMGARAAHTTAAMSDRRRRSEALAEHLRGPSGAGMFVPYVSVCGVRELPMVVIENQADGAKSGYARMQFTQFAEDAIDCIHARDRELFGEALADATGPLPVRTINFVQKKWLVPHTGELGERVDNKNVAETLLWELIAHYSATELRRLFDDLKAAKLNRHDVADAFLMAMHRAQELYVGHARSQLPRRKRGDPFPPVLTAAQLGGGGTIQVVGIDPGFTNLGICHLELVAQQQPPLDAGRPANLTEPLFRVLSMQLVNLHLQELARRYLNSYATMQLGAPTRLYAPDYSSGDIRTFFQRALTVVEQHKSQKEKKEKKRKRAHPDPSPNPSTSKRARTLPQPQPQPPVVVIDLVGGAESESDSGSLVMDEKKEAGGRAKV
jgi:hypothetical protein